MAIRGFIKNIITLYLSYLILKSAISNQPISYTMILLAVITIFLSLWFIAEYIGVIPKCT